MNSKVASPVVDSPQNSGLERHNHPNHTNLFEIIGELDPTAQVPAYKGIANSCLAKSIGAIRQHLRKSEPTNKFISDTANTFTGETLYQRNSYGVSTLDERNEIDENARSAQELSKAMGFDIIMPSLQLAYTLKMVYIFAENQINNLTNEKNYLWNRPLNIDAMMDYMVKNAKGLDEGLLKALSSATGSSQKDLAQFHELQELKEKERLQELRPAITNIFSGFPDDPYIESIEDLSILNQHQLSVKAVDALTKNKEQTIQRIMKTRKMSDLGNISFLDEGINKISTWTKFLEKKYQNEINSVIESGRTIKTIEDGLESILNYNSKSN